MFRDVGRRFLLDVASIHLVRGAKGRLTRRQIVLSAVETTFLVAGFSTCLNFVSTAVVDFACTGRETDTT